MLAWRARARDGGQRIQTASLTQKCLGRERGANAWLAATRDPGRLLGREASFIVEGQVQCNTLKRHSRVRLKEDEMRKTSLPGIRAMRWVRFVHGPLLLLLAAAIGGAFVNLGCDSGGDPPSPTSPSVAPAQSARVTETFTYSLTLGQQGYVISGPAFTTSAGGPIDVTASFQPLPPFQFGIDLLYRGSNPPHNEGSGGQGALGPGPILQGHWEVGFVGQFQARIWPAGAQIPLPVPREGAVIPVVFTIVHP